MDKQTASVALSFLQRMTIQGSEVNAWLAVVRAVSDIAAGSQIVIPARDVPPVDALPIGTRGLHAHG